ncbi:MAG: hypothetical protein IKQ96_01360 [Lachnospiraceae bacterium]|nr:hypothetical protein [Lachnospiraceae bacterium]
MPLINMMTYKRDDPVPPVAGEIGTSGLLGSSGFSGSSGLLGSSGSLGSSGFSGSSGSSGADSRTGPIVVSSSSQPSMLMTTHRVFPRSSFLIV